MQNRFFIFLLILLGCIVSAKAQIAPVLPDTLYVGPPAKDQGPDTQTKLPGQYTLIEAVVYNGQMLLHFSQPVNCEIQLVDMEGQPQLMARVREEDLAVLDISNLHGRFQLIIFSDHWYCTKAYWFP